MRQIKSIIIILLAFAYQTSGQETLEKKIYYTTRLQSQPPKIDGHLNDPCWQEGNWEGNFRQWIPTEGAETSQKTEFKILYDDENLYCAIRAFDTELHKIERRLTRRDQFFDERAAIALDSYFDHRTGHEFSLTAAGAKIDLEVLDNSGGFAVDMDWNAVWYGKTAMEDSAWTAEMRIPFSQLRYSNEKNQIWGLDVWRLNFRTAEIDMWQVIPRNAQGFTHYFGELHGIQYIKSSRRIELLPYTRGSLETFKKETGNPFAKGKRHNIALGLDGKIGISSNFTLDFTVNPDFGQVEADPSVVNLTAFETFFDEKRPFFLEGSQSIMNFQIEDNLLFYSRRIGHKPSYEPDTHDDEHLKMPENTAILSALKLTGKTKDGLSVGVLQSITSIEKAELHSNGQYRKKNVEPLTSYFVSRLQKEYSQGNTILGGMLTATNRRITDDHLKFLPKSAYSGGINFNHQWHNKTYYLDAKAIFSNIQGDTESLIEIQRNPRHYFQRPDASHVGLDSSRTSLSGHGGSIEFGKGANGNWRYSGGFLWFSPGMELNDIGYLRISDVIDQNAMVGYVINKPYGILRNFEMFANQFIEWSFGKEYILSGISLMSYVRFLNNYGFETTIARKSDCLDPRVMRGGPALKIPGNWSLDYSLFSDERKRIRFTLSGRNKQFDDGISRLYMISPGVIFNLGKGLEIRSDVNYTYNKNDLQYVNTKKFNNMDRYIFAQIKQETFGMTFRLNYCLTPELSIQYYGQPFVSAGKYHHFKKISNPKAEKYKDRFCVYSKEEITYNKDANKYYIDENLDQLSDYHFKNPDFNFRQFRSNLVIRWEYTPGSALFLVWSQNRSKEISNGIFAYRDDLHKLFNIYPHNVFLVKLNHWFSI
ncbi:MAG: carbohydrate binding family 9 domain-containing protein [Calditrichales bacterium]|nr:carbohydrate binding family 9 domain-containing protein [Calditrichales bacterium]